MMQINDIKIKVPDSLYELANIFKKKAPLYIVGGYIRNSLLGLGADDIDITSSVTIEEIKELLAGSSFLLKEKSKKLGTLEILTLNGECFEYSTFRKEIYADGGHHTPVSVEFTDDIREDAKRRDFSVNCIYYDILKESYIDIYSGIYDLQKRVLKCVETPDVVFANDGVRILRLIRFACELNFKIDRTTFVQAKKMSYRLRDISGARKYEELTKILNSPQRYPISKKNAYLRGLNLFNTFSLWQYFYAQSPKVKYKMVKKVDKTLRFISLLVDIVDSSIPDCIEYYLQYMLGEKGFGLSNKKIEYDTKIVCGYFDALNRINNKKYFTKYFENFNIISEILRKKSIFIYEKYDFFYQYIINHNLPIVIKDLKIDAKDLKKHFPKLAEKKYKKVLSDLLSKVFEGELENEKEVLLKEVKNNVNCGNY